MPSMNMAHISGRLRPVLITTVLAANIFVVGLLAYMLNAAKDRRESEVRTAAENVALLLDASVTEAVGKIDLSLRATVEELEGELQRHGRLDDQDINASLSNRQKWLTGFSVSFRVIDASGTVKYCNGCELSSEGGLAGRDFFAGHLGAKDSGLMVGGVSTHRSADDWAVWFSRRYDFPDHRLAGVVSASVPIEVFGQVLSKIDLGPRGTALLRDANLALIVRFPPTTEPSLRTGNKVYSKELASIVASGDTARTYHTPQSGDGVERTLSYRRLATVPFHVVAGMATEDYLAEWRELVAKAIALAAFFLVASTGLAWLLWRSSRVAEIANEGRRLLLHNASDGIHILDSRRNLIEVSDAFCNMLGYTRAEMMGMNVKAWDMRFFAGDEPVDFEDRVEDQSEISTFEARHRRKDGSSLDVELTTRPLKVGGQQMLFCSARDITERKAVELKNQRLSNLYAALSQCNQAIVHCESEAELFPKICACVVAYGFAKMAWIAFVEEGSQKVRPVAWYGEGLSQEFLDQIPMTVDPDDQHGRGLTGTAIRDNQPQWSQDYLNDPTTAPWHAFGKKTGWRSSATMPLCRGGVSVGGLVMYSDTVNTFDEDVRKLLVEMAMTISFALDNFAREADRQRSVDALRASERRYRLAFQTSLDSISINRLSDATYVDVNDGFIETTGYRRDEVIGRSAASLNIWVKLDDRQSLIDRLKQSLSCRNVEAQFRKKSGELLWGLMSASLIELDGELCILSVTRDITDIKVAEGEVKKLAFYDPLTQLANRRLLTDGLHHAVAVSARSRQHCALLFVDLDNFKMLNDSSGHAMGDLLLQEVSKRLKAAVREADTVARFGGDEFIVLIEQLSENLGEAATQAEEVGEKILAAMRQPYLLLADREFRGTTSIGITLFGGQNDSPEALLMQADIAMYQAKAAGRNTLRFFSPELQAAINFRAVMEGDLHRAIARGQFQLHYQPQMDHGGLVGAEALIRWHHPERGMVAPGKFIPLAEETGLILPLGQWVLETACRQLAVWAAREDTAHLTLAVNVSAVQFQQPDFVEQTLATLECTGARPQMLKLEIVESMLMNNVEDVIGKMTILRARGVRFSLDDFGTGYSSLSYLKRLPLDQLKIDWSFVKDVLTNANDAAIAQTIVALGKTMGLSVIAEGVETEAQRDFLSRIGCHAFQGYLFGRPMPLEAFQGMLESRVN